MTKRTRAFIVIAGLLALIGVSMFIGTLLTKNQKINRIENRFIDVNGDGLVDYIIKAEVIINNGETNFTPQQSQ